MTVTPEQLAAYVDGECDAAEARRIALAAEHDPDLAQRIAGERALREGLRAHFAPIVEEPIPEEWLALIRGAHEAPAAGAGGTVIDMAEARARREEASRQHGKGWRSQAWIGSAIAASLVLGLFLGLQLRGGSPIAAHNGVLTAQGELARALDTQLASAQDKAPIRMLATFRNGDGAVCRAFAGPDASGVACRAQGDWQLRHVLPGVPQATTEYRQVGSNVGELSALAQGMAAGEAFDAAQEHAARKNGWR